MHYIDSTMDIYIYDTPYLKNLKPLVTIYVTKLNPLTIKAVKTSNFNRILPFCFSEDKRNFDRR